MKQTDHKAEALRAWFDLTTDRIVRDLPLSRRDAERYTNYFEASKLDSEFMSRREYYAFRIAKSAVGQPAADFRLLLLLCCAFFVGMYFGYTVGHMGRFW